MSLTDAERKRLEQRRDRIMSLLREDDAGAGGAALDAEDRKDLEQEWHRLDETLNRS